MKVEKVKVVVDSTSYIPAELVEKYDISVVSLSVIFDSDGQSYREVDIEDDVFYEKMDKSKTIPTSSQPSIKEICDAFEKCILGEDGIGSSDSSQCRNAVVGVFMSSDMSGTCSTANLARDMILQKYPEAVIEIVDSRSNSMQLGFTALEAARAAAEGKNVDEVLEAANRVVARSKFIFAPNTLEYLKKGGRIGGASALLGTLLQIRPILTVIDGKTAILDKVRTSKKAVARMIEIFMEDINKKGLGEVIVHHINDEKSGRALADELEKLIGQKVAICAIGPVIGVHVGPGAVGIAYYTKEALK